MAMEWTREKTLALIQEYRKRRGLWDMTHEDYRKKDVKQKLLVEVSETLGGNIPIMEIEKKFHTLRTQYHREINRMKRKEPYNSKWFGFKYLQFLSSPKACRSNKGRIKAEITEEGTVTTKFIIREAIQPVNDTSMGSGNENEEFLTLPRRSTAISYEAVPASAATSTASSRSHELEKLIEETTKDVEEIEDAKPKMNIKEISLPMEHHHQQHHADTYTGGGELQISNVESEHQELHHIEDVEGNMDAMGMQHHMASDEELNYQTTSSNHGVSSAVSSINAGHTQSSTTTVHTIPARIIKIQRRDTHHDNNDYYEHQHHAQQQHHHHQHLQQQHQHQQQHHIQTVSPSGGATTTKRIYYDPSTHHTTTILTATPSQQQSGVSLLSASSPSINTSPTNSKLHLRNSLAVAAASSGVNSSNSPLNNSALNSSSAVTSALRDEFTTYGEYVANEMREIKSREILLTLKHKINTALFEANMQELQK
ncbi:homeobox protein cut [Calliphora vicina]|uniref:homeobox protein cut n=1 Tax=Calliphora vicina TaxID=7373 RepID=UPI00325A9623